jgi:hypothetical protein
VLDFVDEFVPDGDVYFCHVAPFSPGVSVTDSSRGGR